MENDFERLRDIFRVRSLQDICAYMNRDYQALYDVCEQDCREVWHPASALTFERYLEIHLGRVLAEIRHDPRKLDLYTT